ncbi:hypothetical protein F5Y14DRAFT_397868 [Nemania sp. NC0429]|nr:hypothetical protein F5Y14DRAFT_397868 [Nemania sp. NC0429]
MRRLGVCMSLFPSSLSLFSSWPNSNRSEERAEVTSQACMQIRRVGLPPKDKDKDKDNKPRGRPVATIIHYYLSVCWECEYVF